MNELALFNSLFDGDCLPDVFFRTSPAPKVDVKEDKDAFTLQMDLPGCTEKDVNIELDHGVLTISSVKTEESEEKEKKDGVKWLIRERSTRRFSRRFTLPEDVDENNITAAFKNGVLEVNMARTALPAPKKIAIEMRA